MDASSAPLHVLKCPTCGAPLDVNPAEVTLKCRYCDSVIENPTYRPSPPAAPRVKIEVREVPVEREPRLYPRPKSRPSGAIRFQGCLVIVFFVIFLTSFIAGVSWLS